MFDSVGRGGRQKGPSHAGDKSNRRQAIFHFCAEGATHYPVESAVCEGGTDYPHLQRRKLRFRSKSFSQKVAQLETDPVRVFSISMCVIDRIKRKLAQVLSPGHRGRPLGPGAEVGLRLACEIFSQVTGTCAEKLKG